MNQDTEKDITLTKYKSYILFYHKSYSNLIIYVEHFVNCKILQLSLQGE